MFHNHSLRPVMGEIYNLALIGEVNLHVAKHLFASSPDRRGIIISDDLGEVTFMNLRVFGWLFWF